MIRKRPSWIVLLEDLHWRTIVRNWALNSWLASSCPPVRAEESFPPPRWGQLPIKPRPLIGETTLFYSQSRLPAQGAIRQQAPDPNRASSTLRGKSNLQDRFVLQRYGSLACCWRKNCIRHSVERRSTALDCSCRHAVGHPKAQHQFCNGDCYFGSIARRARRNSVGRRKQPWLFYDMICWTRVSFMTYPAARSRSFFYFSDACSPPWKCLTSADVSCMQLDGPSHNAKMDRGVQLVTAIWVLTILSLGLVALRLYTRIRIVRFIGTEDHLYAWTGVLLLVFACSLQLAQHYGLGKDFWKLSPESSSQAIFWTYVANTFAITGNCFAKLSMASFLLRVVQLRWQRVSLWILVLITAGTSVAWVIMLWNQTTPIKASWDPLRTPGKWNIQIKPMSIGLGGTRLSLL